MRSSLLLLLIIVVSLTAALKHKVKHGKEERCLNTRCPRGHHCVVIQDDVDEEKQEICFKNSKLKRTTTKPTDNPCAPFKVDAAGPVILPCHVDAGCEIRERSTLVEGDVIREKYAVCDFKNVTYRSVTTDDICAPNGRIDACPHGLTCNVLNQTTNSHTILSKFCGSDVPDLCANHKCNDDQNCIRTGSHSCEEDGKCEHAAGSFCEDAEKPTETTSVPVADNSTVCDEVDGTLPCPEENTRCLIGKQRCSERDQTLCPDRARCVLAEGFKITSDEVSHPCAHIVNVDDALKLNVGFTKEVGGYHVVGHVHFRKQPPPHTPTGVGYSQGTRGDLHAPIHKIAYKVSQPVRFTLFSEEQKVDLGSELLTVNERAILLSFENHTRGAVMAMITMEDGSDLVPGVVEFLRINTCSDEDIKVHQNERIQQRNKCNARYENYRECNEPDGIVKTACVDHGKEGNECSRQAVLRSVRRHTVINMNPQ